MVKTKIRLIVCLTVVFLATMFLWSGKTPFAAHETSEPDVSPPKISQPDEQDPSGNPGDDNLIDEPEAPGDPASAEQPGNPGEADGVQPENPAYTPVEVMLELPVEGATGWAGTAMPLYSDANVESQVITDFEAGQVFVIKKELGDWWYVESSEGKAGWVEHAGCLINLPDVIPSIAYNVTNAYSALTRSSGYEIPGVTGQKLYDAWAYNPRLMRFEFIVPSLYSTSKLLYRAQQLALEAGDTIILHEAYRAHASQQRSVALLMELMEENEEVNEAITTDPWSLNWFIATTISNHQRGVAFDVSLGRVISHDIMQVGEMSFTRNITYEEYIMPTTIHELSPLAITFTEPVSSRSRDAWRSAPLSDTMTPGAILLQNYFTEAGFTPLASEWWHFNDLDGVAASSKIGIVGSFFISEILSFLP